MDAAIATIGHNSPPASVMIVDDPALVYRDPEMLAAALKEFADQIANAPVDLTTAAGRDAIKSRSAEFSRRKVAIADAGKALTEEWRKETAKVNTVKSTVEREFDALRDLARKPLTEWEEVKKKRDAEIESTIARIDQSGVVVVDATAADVEQRLAWLAGIDISDDAFGAFQPIAAGKRQRVTEALSAALTRIHQAERDKAELDRLRAEQAERDRAAKEEADKLAKEQADKDRIAKAAQDAIDEERRKAQQAIDDANRRADEIKRQADQAEQARLAEQKRKDDAAEAQRLADEARQKDIDHRGNIMRAAKEALMEQAGITEDKAKKAVLAIVAGTIPHTSIRF